MFQKHSDIPFPPFSGGGGFLSVCKNKPAATVRLKENIREGMAASALEMCHGVSEVEIGKVFLPHAIVST